MSNKFTSVLAALTNAATILYISDHFYFKMTSLKDPILVIVVLLILGNIFTWLVVYGKKKEICDLDQDRNKYRMMIPENWTPETFNTYPEVRKQLLVFLDQVLEMEEKDRHEFMHKFVDSRIEAEALEAMKEEQQANEC